MQESITIANIGIRCVHMRTTYDLKQISTKYKVVIELANIQNGENDNFFSTDDPLELMLLGLKEGDTCKIKVEGETGSCSPATSEVLIILNATSTALA
jgi:phosphotransferase system HPr-like phosphotransfer protein